MEIAVVGAGLYGATVAHQMTKAGHRVTVYDKAPSVGGNVASYYDAKIGCHVSKHGAHIFHTNSAKIWHFVNQFTTFNDYRHYVKGMSDDGRLVDLPFGMSMFSQILNITTPEAARNWFSEFHGKTPDAEDTVTSWCLTNIGSVLYQKVVKNYTEKQWGKPCDQLPADIIRRLPLRFTYDNTYFNNAKFQGMPVLGYQALVDGLLQSVSKVETGCLADSFIVAELHANHDLIFFSGPLDQLFNYREGVLPYRGLTFKDEYYPVNFKLGMPVLNDLSVSKHTRQIEHKLFYPEVDSNKNQTLVTTEFPAEWKPGDTPYYPIRDSNSSILHQKYLDLSQRHYPKMVVGGRLGAYRYYDMDQVVGMALADTNKYTINQ